MGGLGGLLGDIGRSGIAGDIINYENMRTNRAQQQWQNEQDRLTSPLKIEALRQENEMRRNAMVQAQREQAQRAEKEKYMKTPRPLDDLLGAYSQYIPEQTMGNIKRTLMKAGIAEPISGPDGQQVLMASPWKLKAGFESIPGAEKWAEQMIQAAYVENIGILKKKKEQLNEYSDPVKRMENPQKFQTLQEEVQKYQAITDKMTPFLSTEQQKFIQQKDMLEAKDQNTQEKMVMVDINGQNVPMTAAQYQAHLDRQEALEWRKQDAKARREESRIARADRAAEKPGKEIDTDLKIQRLAKQRIAMKYGKLGVTYNSLTDEWKLPPGVSQEAINNDFNTEVSRLEQQYKGKASGGSAKGDPVVIRHLVSNR